MACDQALAWWRWCGRFRKFSGTPGIEWHPFFFHVNINLNCTWMILDVSSVTALFQATQLEIVFSSASHATGLSLIFFNQVVHAAKVFRRQELYVMHRIFGVSGSLLGMIVSRFSYCSLLCAEQGAFWHGNLEAFLLGKAAVSGKRYLHIILAVGFPLGLSRNPV